jgi:carbamate kinase
MRIVAALGGNALLRRGEALDAGTQRANARVAARALAAVAGPHDLIVTHGNGPQVGLLALQAAKDEEHAAPPFDVLGAETDGMIGYVLAQELGNALGGRRIAPLLTQTLVDAGDPAFSAPTKPIGPVYPAAEGRALGARLGWVMGPDGAGVRRLIASPLPRGIVELPAIRALLAAGLLVICAGGGGVPVVRRDDGLHGVEAVVDKDLTSALLAEELGADLLLLLTDVEGVREADGSVLRVATPPALRALALPAGSMGPKAEAAAAFVQRTGARAAIGALADVAALVDGSAGTQVRAPACGPPPAARGELRSSLRDTPVGTPAAGS